MPSQWRGNLANGSDTGHALSAATRRMKWPLIHQLITLWIKGHFMKLLGSVICVTSLSAVYRLSLWMLPYGISYVWRLNFIWTEVLKVFKKKISSLCLNHITYFAIFKTQCCINKQKSPCINCRNCKIWQKMHWQTAKAGDIMTANGALARVPHFIY